MPPVPSPCALCLQPKPLEQSHLVPKFVFRWMRDTQPGLFRVSGDPNRRVQDGPKLRLLCRDCEARFAVWERAFANEVFFPVHNAERGTFVRSPYGPWMLKFATSLSWRTLQRLRSLGELEHHEPERVEVVLRAAETWRRHLLGELPHPGEFEQHIYKVGEIAHLPNPQDFVSDRLNVYMTRTVDATLVTGDDNTTLVYTKFARFIVLGFVHMEDRRGWTGRISSRQGFVGARRQVMHEDFFKLLNARARAVGEAMDAMSPAQTELVRNMVSEAGDAYFETEVFKAILADMRLAAALEQE